MTHVNELKTEILKTEIQRLTRIAETFKRQHAADIATAERLEARHGYDPIGDKASARNYRSYASDALSTANIYFDLVADLEEHLFAIEPVEALKVVKV
jgi:hypothetical protein